MEFSTITEGGRTAMVRHEGRLVIAAALLDGEGCEPMASRGRGTVWRFPFEDGYGVVRVFQRGGVVRHVVKNGYLYVNRPRREFRVHRRLYERGLCVPEPLGVSWERRGPVIRGAIATRYVESTTLLEYLSEGPNEPEPVLERAGEAVRAMHNMGCRHPDLQVRNILVADDCVLLIDFDRARLTDSVGRLTRARNLLRLRRSMTKNMLPARFFESILRGYGMETLPRWLDRLYVTKGRLSDTTFGRMGE